MNHTELYMQIRYPLKPFQEKIREITDTKDSNTLVNCFENYPKEFSSGLLERAKSRIKIPSPSTSSSFQARLQEIASQLTAERSLHEAIIYNHIQVAPQN